MAFRVEVSPSALHDIESAYLWISEQTSKARADRWYNGLVDAIASLDTLPRRCPLAPESKEIGAVLYHLLYGKRSAVYRILFSVSGEEADGIVRIYRFWHGARDRLTSEDLEEEP